MADVVAPIEPVDTSVAIETPEQVRFNYQLAGPAQRGAAYAIDLVVRAVLASFITLGAKLVGGVGESGLAGVSAGATLLGLFAVEWGYYVACEMLLSGQSIGKRALRLRVVKQDGLPIGFTDSVLRNLLRAADFLPWAYAGAFVVMGLDPRFRRLGDMVAGTLVISEERQALRASVRIDPPPTEQELARLPPDLRLSSDALDAIGYFLNRHGELGPAREEELAELLAPLLSRRLGVRYRYAPRFLALIYAHALGRSGR